MSQSKQNQLQTDLNEMHRLMAAFEKLYADCPSETLEDRKREMRLNRIRMGIRVWISHGNTQVKRPKTSKQTKEVSNGN